MKSFLWRRDFHAWEEVEVFMGIGSRIWSERGDLVVGNFLGTRKLKCHPGTHPAAAEWKQHLHQEIKAALTDAWGGCKDTGLP